MKCIICGKETKNGNYCEECIENFKNELLKKFEEVEIREKNNLMKEEEELKRKNQVNDVSNIYNCSPEETNGVIRYNRFSWIREWIVDNFGKIIIFIIVFFIILFIFLNHMKIAK